MKKKPAGTSSSECPLCRGNDLTEGSLVRQGYRVFQDGECKDCGAAWTVEFAVTSTTVTSRRIKS